MVNNRNQDSRCKPANQAVREAARELNKIGASTPYDFEAKHLTAYGGLLPVAADLPRFSLPGLIWKAVLHITSVSHPPGELRAHHCIFIRRAVRQAAVQSFFVVLHPPPFDLLLRIHDAYEPVRIQAFIAQPSAEAFQISVLHRLARLNGHRGNAMFFAPGQEMPAGELRPVIAAQTLWRPASGDDAFQYSRDSPAAEAHPRLPWPGIPA